MEELKKHIIHTPDFPKPGVVFQDMSAILADPKLRKLLSQQMNECVFLSPIGTNIDKIVGLDSRGYIYGIDLANSLGCGFVMARKPGKTPGSFKFVDYGTEYSKATIEIMDGIINKGDKVLIVDDLVATGGSLWAARKLVEEFGGKVVGAFTVLKVDPLFEQAQEKFGKDVPILTLF